MVILSILARTSCDEKSDVRAQSIQLKNINFRVSSQFKKDTCGQIRLERGKSFTCPGKKVKRNEEKCLEIVNTYLKKNPCLTRADYCQLTGCDKRSAPRELNSFIERGVLMRYGSGKQVVYAKVMELL